MGSYNAGKKEICDWIRSQFQKDAEILDVGACDGKWRSLLPEYPNMDAVEIYPPNVMAIRGIYRNVFEGDVAELAYDHYDLTIFGDVIEHMTVEKAQRVLEYATQHSGTVLVGVPFLYKQGELYGNKWERHIQDDLTAEIFAERYPGFRTLLRAAGDYRYYVNG